MRAFTFLGGNQNISGLAMALSRQMSFPSQDVEHASALQKEIRLCQCMRCLTGIFHVVGGGVYYQGGCREYGTTVEAKCSGLKLSSIGTVGGIQRKCRA